MSLIMQRAYYNEKYVPFVDVQCSLIEKLFHLNTEYVCYAWFFAMLKKLYYIQQYLDLHL